jgi:hypothetical protein
MFINSLGIIRFFHPKPPRRKLLSFRQSDSPLRLHLSNILDHIHLLLIRAIALSNATKTLSELLTTATDLVPGQVEDSIHGLEALVGEFREEEVDPCETDGGDTNEEHHGAAGAHGDEHGGDSLGVAVFCVRC